MSAVRFAADVAYHSVVSLRDRLRRIGDRMLGGWLR